MEYRNEMAALGIVAFIFIGAVMITGGEPDSSELGEASKVEASFIDDGEELTTVELETAYTPEERAEGLMFREELGEDEGMIFVYDESEERSFWMKNTLIPLDMIFVQSDRTVDSVKKADPEPDVPDEELESYESDGPALFVIEVNQNYSEKHGITEGTDVVLEIAD